MFLLAENASLNMELVHGITGAFRRPFFRSTYASSVRSGFVPVPALRPSSVRVLRPCPFCSFSGDRSSFCYAVGLVVIAAPRGAGLNPEEESPASGSSSKECDLATFLCHLCQTWFHYQFGLPWRTPFVTMLVPDPTSLDDEDIARAVTTRSEELTLAHHVFVDEVLRSFGGCHGAVKIACVCQFTETVSVMERELRAPHVILFRVSFRSWLRQPLCQSPATALRRKESISVCVNISIFISFDGLAHATPQSREFGSSGLRPAPLWSGAIFPCVQLWTVRAHAPFERLGSVSGRDVTISVRRRLLPRRCQDVPGRLFGFLSLFLRSFSAAALRRSMLPAVSPTPEPDSHGMFLVADGSPYGAADLAHSLFLLRPTRFCARKFPCQTPAHAGAAWQRCKRGAGADLGGTVTTC